MTQKLDETDLRRVSMVWPADLKEQVRGLVGSRGLTDFTLDAVRAKLQQLAVDEPPPPPKPPAAAPPAPAAAPPGRAGQCSKCLEDLVNGECWTCPPG